MRAALETFRLKRMLEAQRRDHIAMLVHDLRHPLSSLGLIAEVLDAEDLNPQERRHVVGQIRSMCTEMARLVDDVLVASRLEAGVFSVEPRTVRVGTVIEPILSVFTPVAARRRVALAFDGSLDLEVKADPQKLRQALDNLVANALKFTPRGGRVRVRVWREAAQARRKRKRYRVLRDRRLRAGRRARGSKARSSTATSRVRAAGPPAGQVWVSRSRAASPRPTAAPFRSRPGTWAEPPFASPCPPDPPPLDIPRPARKVPRSAQARGNPVANHPSAEKRNRQRIKRTIRNRAVRSAVRTEVKDVREALAAKDAKAAKEALEVAVKALDKAAGKGAVPRKTASRKVSRLAAQVHALQQSQAPQKSK